MPSGQFSNYNIHSYDVLDPIYAPAVIRCLEQGSEGCSDYKRYSIRCFGGLLSKSREVNSGIVYVWARIPKCALVLFWLAALKVSRIFKKI